MGRAAVTMGVMVCSRPRQPERAGLDAFRARRFPLPGRRDFVCRTFTCLVLAWLAFAGGMASAQSDGLSLTLSANSVASCGYVIVTIILAQAAPNGAQVDLAASPAAVNLPPKAVVLSGSNRATIYAVTRPVRERTTVQITARHGSSVATARLILTPPALYSIVDLGTLGGDMSMASAINASGRVAGISRTPEGRLHGFLTDASGAMRDMAPTRTEAVHIAAVNDTGRVAGWLEDAQGSRRAFVTDGGGAVTPLTVPGAVQSQAFGLNNAGEAAGYYTSASRDNRAFRMAADGTVADLGTFADGTYSVACALTTEGAVAGFGDGGNRAFAFRTQPGGGVSSAARIGPHAYGYAVNAAGSVAGEVLSADGFFHAFRSGPDGSLHDLGTLGRWDAAALGINAHGDVVGATYLLGGPEGRAFLYTDGRGLRDLNDLIPPDAGWVLVSATGLNDAGQIAGYGRKDGLTRAFRLDPMVPPTLYGDADRSGLVAASDVASLLATAGGLGTAADLRAGDVAPAPSCAPGGVGDGRLDIRDAVRVLRRLHAREPLWP